MEFMDESVELSSIVDPAHKGCYVDRVAYDIGAKATQYIAATINICNHTIEHVFSQNVYPVQYQQDLLESLNNEFSDPVRLLGMRALKSAKIQAEIDFYLASPGPSARPTQELEHCGVVAAAFREANNGIHYASYLSEALEIPIDLISQEDEGKLAYYGAISQLKDMIEDFRDPIVWEIGDRCMQLTYKDEQGDFYIMTEELATNTFAALVLEKIYQKDLIESPHPMNADEVKEAIKLAKDYLVYNSIAKDVIAKQVKNGTKVVAVGSVHNHEIQPLCNIAMNQQSTSYSQEDLLHAIHVLTDKTDEEIAQLCTGLNEQNVKTRLINLILTYSLMDLYDIENVHTLSSSNVEGILLKGCTKK